MPERNSTAPVALQIQNVSKTFRTKAGSVHAVNHVSLDIYQGEFVSIIGPSGCGKTTLLRLIAGLEQEYEGDILLDGRRIHAPGRDRGIIFQEHRLFPWMSVGDNVAMSLSGKKAHNREKVRYYLEKVGLQDFEKAFPGQLSGGMAQRAAIARALINQPKVLLLDEPLGALDALTRIYMQREIERIWKTEKTTMILITHDIEESIFLGDRVIVMSARPAQINTVVEVPVARSRDRRSPGFMQVRREVENAFHETIGTWAI